MQKIIIYLQSDDIAQASWAMVSASDAIQKTSVTGTLDELKMFAAEHEVIAIAPPAEVLLTQANMPKLNRHRMLQALPYALEEQLLTDVSELHFALGDYKPEGVLPVAIATRAKMQMWLNTLHSIGVFPSVMLPAALAVPLVENCWNVFVINTIAIVRTGITSGFSGDGRNLSELLELALADTAHKPQAIYLENYTSSPLGLKINGINVIEKSFPETKFIEDLALKITAPAINLLQAPYQPKHKPSQNKKIWVIAACLLGAWLGITFFMNIISLGILHYQTAALESGINTIYKRNFPHASAVVAPKERMLEKLNTLQNGNKNHLLVWLASLGKSLPEVGGIQIKQLDYRNNQLSLEFSTANFDKVDTLSKSLVQQGLTVKQHNVAANGAVVNGILLITETKS